MNCKNSGASYDKNPVTKNYLFNLHVISLCDTSPADLT